MVNRLSCNMEKGFYFFAAFLLIASKSWSMDDSGLHSTPSQFRLTYETLNLPHHEKMGLAGGTFLFHLNDWFSLGPAAYGAISGHRGGFITLGMAADLNKKLTQYLSVDTGLFVGGGGGDGGYTLVGGGLMLRTHLGLFIDTNQWGSFGAGASFVDFPNGGFSSAQPYFSYQYSFHTFVAPGWLEDLSTPTASDDAIPSSHREFAVVYKNYFIPNGVLTNAGTPQHQSIGLMGAEWYRYFYDRLFFKVESEGAMGGESNGYMQILLGTGYRQPLTASTFVKLVGQLGAAGGGGVYTGGGLLLDASLGLQQYLTRSLYVSVNGGYTAAPTGQFKASNVGLQLGYGYDVPNTNADFITWSDLNAFDFKHLRARATNQTYFKANPRWRTHHSNEQVNLLGLQLDYFTTNHIYVTGQGLGAYQGNAGAYMIGLLGAGYYTPLFSSPLFLNGEGLIGAAGGGGLDVGGGFVWQTNVGLGYQLTRAISLLATYGYVSAPNGNFRANVLGITLGYQFTGFAKPPQPSQGLIKH